MPLELHEDKEGTQHLTWWCEPCDSHHSVPVVVGPNPPEKKVWGFNGDLKKPTLTPSVHYLGWKDQNGNIKGKCHLFLRNGMVQYLSDCSHDMAGKTVKVQDPK